jgi:hypothetical protein
MRAEEGDESIDELAGRAQQAKNSVADALDDPDENSDEHLDDTTPAPRRPAPAPDLDQGVDQGVDTPVDEALGGVPSPTDESPADE